MQRLNSSSMPTINLSNIEAAQVRLQGPARCIGPISTDDDLCFGHLHCYSPLQAAAGSSTSVLT